MNELVDLLHQVKNELHQHGLGKLARHSDLSALVANKGISAGIGAGIGAGFGAQQDKAIQGAMVGAGIGVMLGWLLESPSQSLNNKSCCAKSDAGSKQEENNVKSDNR